MLVGSRLRSALGLACAIVLVAALAPLVGNAVQTTGASTPTLSDFSPDHDWGAGAFATAPQPAIIVGLCSALTLLALAVAHRGVALREAPRTRGPPAR